MNKAKYVVGRQCEQTSEYSATQLVSSIKFKLSHAIKDESKHSIID